MIGAGVVALALASVLGAAIWALLAAALLWGVSMLRLAHPLRVAAVALAPIPLLAGTPLDSLLDLRLLMAAALAGTCWVPLFGVLGARIPVLAPVAVTFAAVAGVAALLLVPGLEPLAGGDVATRSQAALLGVAGLLAAAVGAHLRSTA